jgi:DNA-directed RNA polymerase alpha subunit
MFSRSEMRKWPNFGRKCLNEVEEMLRARGLQLWENHDERSLRLLREHKEYFK